MAEKKGGCIKDALGCLFPIALYFIIPSLVIILISLFEGDGIFARKLSVMELSAQKTVIFPTLFRPSSIPYPTDTPTTTPRQIITVFAPTSTKKANYPFSTSTLSFSGCPNGCIYHPNSCDIKGNISNNSGERIYHLPGMNFYNDTIINPDLGERWFCTEAEAISNGWRKANN
jgi:hypothetical protein